MSDLNKDVTPNRGVEFMLSGGKRKKPKLFNIIFEKLICIHKREITIYFEFSIQLRKVN